MFDYFRCKLLNSIFSDFPNLLCGIYLDIQSTLVVYIQLSKHVGISPLSENLYEINVLFLDMVLETLFSSQKAFWYEKNLKELCSKQLHRSCE